MPDQINSPWNYAVTFLELAFNDTVLASGSGFFWKNQNQTFLVTNWHNLSGRDNETGAPISNTGAIPNLINFHAYQKISPEDEQGRFVLNITKHTVPLINDNGDNLWYEHPQLGRKADIAALSTNNLENFGLVINCANVLETDSAQEFYVSEDVFIIGYPLGLVSSSIPIPVWKRGTIATEPYINPDGKPLIYVDAATRKGMSGSVVISKEMVMGPYPKKDGTLKSDNFWARLQQVVGVYSGRLHPHNVEAQLGIVWKRHLIDELVSSKKIADTSF